MKDFMNIFSKYPTDKPKYADFYQRHFAGLDPRLLLEIGVLEGGSLRAWKEIFPEARIIGIDIKQSVKDENSDLEVYVGDQTDKAFLSQVVMEVGIPDIIIDDGGHSRYQQITSFSFLFTRLLKGGVYVVEDLETSFLEAYDDFSISVMDVLQSHVFPSNFFGKTEGRKIGDGFNYIYSSITFEPNVCILVRG